MRRLRRQGPGPCLFLFALLSVTGPGGVLAHGVWSELSAPTSLTLNAVRFYHRADGWAAGDAGVMLRYQKGAWENFPSGTDRRLNDLAVLGTGDAWAVGEEGTIMRYHKHLWDFEQTREIRIRSGVTCLDSHSAYEPVDFNLPNGSAYVAGSMTVEVSPRNVVCDGKSWTPRSIGISWTRVTGLPFEAGEPPDGMTDPLIIRVGVADPFNGTDVTLKFRYRQTVATWRRDAQGSALTLLPLQAVAFLTPDIGWAVGGSPAQGGIALRYNGTGWISATATSQPLYDVETVADDLVWACGGNRRIVKFDGTRFTEFDPTPCGLVPDGLAWRTIAFPYRSIGYVAGEGGVIWRYSSSNLCFEPVSSPVSATIRALSLVTGSGVGYAVGDGGQRLHFNGAAFEDEVSGGGDLRAIHMLNELEGVAVGGTGGPRILSLRLNTTETTLVNVRVFPNPFDPNRSETLKLDRLPADVSTLEIFTVRGERIAGLGDGVLYNPATGQAEWPGRVRGGKPAASGAYVYRIETRSGLRGRGILLVVKQ